MILVQASIHASSAGFLGTPKIPSFSKIIHANSILNSIISEIAMAGVFFKGNFLQSGFCANFFGLKVKSCSNYGVAREKRKQSEKRSEKRIFFAEFFREFSMRVFPQ